jgi:hypothetical protein
MIDLTEDEIDVITEALRYAKRAVLDELHSPKAVKDAKAARIESASRKLAQLRLLTKGAGS